MRELAKGNIVTLGCHSYNMHRYKPRFGIGQMSGESDENYVKAVKNDTERLQNKFIEATGRASNVYAYPFGKYSPLARKTLEDMGIEMFLTCNEGVSTVTFADPSSIKQLKRINREGNYTIGQFIELFSE